MQILMEADKIAKLQTPELTKAGNFWYKMLICLTASTWVFHFKTAVILSTATGDII